MIVHKNSTFIDKPEAKAQSKDQSPKKPQKGKKGIWPLG